MNWLILTQERLLSKARLYRLKQAMSRPVRLCDPQGGGSLVG